MRSAVHALGLRYRVDHPVRIEGRRPIRPDLVFASPRVAVFVDGCFWHGCPEHGTQPASRTEYWDRKIAENKERDARNARDLSDAGWIVVRVWEHEAPDDAARRIAAVVASARTRL